MLNKKDKRKMLNKLERHCEIVQFYSKQNSVLSIDFIGASGCITYHLKLKL